MSADRDLQRQIVEVLNEEIGSDLKHLFRLKQLYEETKALQNNLKEKLSLISTEAPTKIQSTLQDVQDFMDSLDALNGQFDELKAKSSEHLEKSGTFLADLKDKLELVDKYEHQRFYLECIKIIESLSEKLQQCVQSNQDMEAVQLYNDIVLFSNSFQESSCRHLVNYLNQTALFWFDLLKEKLRKEFQESLKMIQWPLISSNQEVLKAPPTHEIMANFKLQFQCLSTLQVPPNHDEDASRGADGGTSGGPLARFVRPSRGVEELLAPLQRRFAYHFSGNRPTNRRDKPEWYLRQILQWIADHERFICDHVQPVYGEQSDALLEFSRGLVQLAVEKLVKETPAVLADDAVLAHTIGEVLAFEAELRSSAEYPPSQPSPLLVLTQPQFFAHWIALEKACAVEKMDVLLSSETAWCCVDQDADAFDAADGDGADGGVRLTECAEGFLQMLLSVTDRYKSLPQPGHRLQFLDLQLDLLDEFRIRLVQLARQDALLDLQLSSKTSPNICAILNTLSSVVDVLNDWSDLPFFVQLYSYKVQTESVERQAALVMGGAGGGGGGEGGGALPWLRTQTRRCADEADVDAADAGCVFDAIVDLLKRMQDDLLKKVVDAVMLEVKAKSQPYRLDKWASLPSADAYLQPSLSPTGSSMLQAVALGLQWMQDSLASSLFREAWQQLAAQLNDFLVEELVLQRHFNDGGTAQLCHDVEQNLLPLFRQFTGRPESYFRELKDACLLLRLPRPINLLLVDTLVQCVQVDAASARSSRTVANAKQALKDQGVVKLNLEDALSVLRRRIL